MMILFDASRLCAQVAAGLQSADWKERLEAVSAVLDGVNAMDTAAAGAAAETVVR